MFTLVVPAYNEDLYIRTTLEKLKEHYPEADILVVDDGSSDGTAEIAQGMEVRLIRHTENRGYGAALKTGVKYARHNLVVFFDADGQHDPKDVGYVVDRIGQADMVVGARGKDSFVNLTRRPGKRLLSWVANFVANKSIPDVNSGLRAVKVDVIKKYLHLLPDGFSATTSMTLIMLQRGYSVEYVPIRVVKRVGKSELSQLRDGINTIIGVLRMLTLFSPLRFFLPVSAFLFVVGTIYGFYMAFTMRLGFPIGGLILIVTGLLTFFFGILSDQISALRKEKYE